MPESTSAERDPLTNAIIGAAIEVHRNLGPGLLESIYEACLVWELRERGVGVEQQVAVPIVYKGHELRIAYRVDLLVERSVIVEVKAVDRLHPLTDAQVLTYLKLSSLNTALVLNFNVALLRDGVRRLVL
jgi:GxxExxY protein